MENTEEFLDQDDVLSRIHQYELERDEERVFINVREPIGGSAKGSFIAFPRKDCLKRIKGLPLRQIIPQG